jgi:hypothetical protein
VTAVALTSADLVPFGVIETAKAQAMIDDVLAIAARVAPYAFEDNFEYPEAAKAILRGAVLRRNDAGSGGIVQRQRTDGPFTRSETVDQKRTDILTEEERDALKELHTGEAKSAFSIDTAPGGSVVHADVCSLNFGANYCSCGASLSGFPLWE